jgi:hypothetical protein
MDIIVIPVDENKYEVICLNKLMFTVIREKTRWFAYDIENAKLIDEDQYRYDLFERLNLRCKIS